MCVVLEARGVGLGGKRGGTGSPRSGVRWRWRSLYLALLDSQNSVVEVVLSCLDV